MCDTPAVNTARTRRCSARWGWHCDGEHISVCAQEAPSGPAWVGYAKIGAVLAIVAAVITVFATVDVSAAFKDLLAWIDGLGRERNCRAGRRA
jgi:hypothetical protein